jgi:hypothetical protein
VENDLGWPRLLLMVIRYKDPRSIAARGEDDEAYYPFDYCSSRGSRRVGASAASAFAQHELFRYKHQPWQRRRLSLDFSNAANIYSANKAVSG